MSKADKKYYDVETESNIIKALLQNNDFCRNSLTFNTITLEHFTDLFHIDCFNAILRYFNKFGRAPKKKYFRKYLIRSLTYHNKFKSKMRQKEIWLKSANRLYRDLAMSSKEIQSELDYLDSLRQGRNIQKGIIKIVNEFDRENYDEVYSAMNKTVKKSKYTSRTVDTGEIWEDLSIHKKLDKQIKKGYFNPIKSGLVGVSEINNKIKVVRLDDFLAGGSYAGEMTLIVGEVNVGKSFVLNEYCHNGATIDKKNTLLITIEMGKIKAERRELSRISHIPYYKFKEGLLTKKDWRNIKEKKEEWNSKGYGKIAFAAFDMGATVQDIINIHDDKENQYGVPFDLVSVDYINDLTPPSGKKYMDSKSWTAIGDISDELKNWAKYHNNHKGLVIIAANQKKTKYYGSGDTKIGSSQGSALPEHHATVVLGLGQDENDILLKRIRVDMPKNRDGEKGISFYMFTDYRISKVSSIRRLKEYYSALKGD